MQFVKEQTPEICLAAVKQNIFALKFVKEQTPEILSEVAKKINQSWNKKIDVTVYCYWK